MIIYILSFFASLFFLYLGIRDHSNKNNKIFIAIALLIPCILAGCRDVSIGTDTGGYVSNLFDYAKEADDIGDFFQVAYSKYAQRDYLYLTTTYIISKAGLSFGVLLFVNELLVVAPIYLAIKKMRFNKRNSIYAMAIFYFTLYNTSLNIIRQSIAIAFSVLAYAYLIMAKNRRDKIIALIILLLGVEFHITAAIMLLVFVCRKFFMSKKISLDTKAFVSVGGVAIATLIVIFYKQFLGFLAETGIYPLADYYMIRFAGNDFSFYQLAINLLILLMVIINSKTNIMAKSTHYYLIAISIINLIISSGMGYYITYSQRIMYYIQYIILICYIPAIKGQGNYKYARPFFICVIIMSWFLYFALKNVNETVPYITSF